MLKKKTGTFLFRNEPRNDFTKFIGGKRAAFMLNLVEITVTNKERQAWNKSTNSHPRYGQRSGHIESCVSRKNPFPLAILTEFSLSIMCFSSSFCGLNNWRMSCEYVMIELEKSSLS